MLTRIFAGLAVLLAAIAIIDGYTQKSALVLREQKQANYSPRHGTNLSGGYSRGGIWIYSTTTRGYYEDFRGGGPGRGK